MGKLQNNQKGFTALEGSLVVLILAVIGVVGYMVYHNDYKTKTVSVTTRSNNKPATTTSTPKTTDTVTYKTYSDYAAQASFQYPSTWTIANIRGACDEPNGCAPSTDKISAQLVTSPDGSVEIVWSGLSGVGGNCYNNVPPTQSGGCNIETVFNATPIPNASGLYVVEGAKEVSSGLYIPFLAVQDKNGVLTSGEHNLWYQSFTLPSTGHHTLFNMNNGYKDAGGGANPQTFATTSQVQAYLNSPDVTQAKQILLSLQVQ